MYVTLLSESHGRMLAHLSNMKFFDPAVAGEGIHYISGYEALRSEGLNGLLTLIRKAVKRDGATLLVIDGITRAENAEVEIPVPGVSGFVENIVLVRQLEIASELKRPVAVMKTREGAHDDRLREMKINDKGVEVGDPFEFEDAVLTGGSMRRRLPSNAKGARSQ